MREIRLSGSEGGVALTTPLLPLSFRVQQPVGLRTRRTASWACSPTRKAA